MNVYEKNIELLNSRYSGMGTLFQEAYDRCNEDVQYYEEEYDGDKVLRIEHSGNICYMNGKRNRKEPAERWAKSLGELVPNAPILIVGTANTEYFKQLEEKLNKPATILIYEPSIKLFHYFIKVYDIQKLMENNTVIFWIEGLTGMTDSALQHIIGSLLKYEMLNLSRRLIIPNYDVLFPNETLKFIKICRDISKTADFTRNTQVAFSSVTAKNVLSNIRFIPEASKTYQFAGVFPENTVGILVAAGPSLNKNIRELKKAKGKAFIVATDTALKPLIKEGIVPDMLVIVDGKKPTLLFDVNELSDIPLLCSLLSASDVLDMHKGKKIVCNEGLAVADKIMSFSHIGLSPMPIGGSVATFAFSFMYMIGIKTIILIGQDLAYTGNKSHADGTFEEKMPEVDTSKYIMVEGNYEKEVPTSPDFKIYLEWYDEYIEKAMKATPGFRVINSTEGGAKIRGTELMTLRDAILKECKISIDGKKILKDVPSMMYEDEKKKAETYIMDIPIQCNNLIRYANSAKAKYKKLESICKKKNADVKEYLSIYKKLEKNLKEIESIDIYDLVTDSLADAQYIIKNEQFLEYSSTQEEGMEIARKGILYMDIVSECAEIFKQFCEDIY